METEKIEIKAWKVVLVAIIAILLILGIVLIIKNAANSGSKPNKQGLKIGESEIEGIQVKDVDIIYSEERNETTLNFTIENIDDKKIENKIIKVSLIGENEQYISSVEFELSILEPKNEWKASIVVAGNMEHAKKVKLEKTDTVFVTPEESEKSE